MYINLLNKEKVWSISRHAFLPTSRPSTE